MLDNPTWQCVGSGMKTKFVETIAILHQVKVMSQEIFSAHLPHLWKLAQFNT